MFRPYILIWFCQGSCTCFLCMFFWGGVVWVFRRIVECIRCILPKGCLINFIGLTGSQVRSEYCCWCCCNRNLFGCLVVFCFIMIHQFIMSGVMFSYALFNLHFFFADDTKQNGIVVCVFCICSHLQPAG